MVISDTRILSRQMSEDKKNEPKRGESEKGWMEKEQIEHISLIHSKLRVGIYIIWTHTWNDIFWKLQLQLNLNKI